MKSMMERKTKASAFTLTEVLIAVAIVGIIAGLVLPKAFSSYQKRTFDSAFEREIQTIQNSIDGLAVSENKADFFSTMMYVETKPDNYDDSVGLYMKKYLRTTSICDEPKNCFADEYYIYEKGKKRDEYKPDYKGACAILKNGMSLCLTPQIGADNIYGVIDLNGKKGPNVFDRDLRVFTIGMKTRIGQNKDTEGVIRLDWENLEGEEPEIEEPTPPPEPDPCETNPKGLGCCLTKTISNANDDCCTYEEIRKNNPACTKTATIQVLWDKDSDDNDSRPSCEDGGNCWEEKYMIYEVKASDGAPVKISVEYDRVRTAASSSYCVVSCNGSGSYWQGRTCITTTHKKESGTNYLEYTYEREKKQRHGCKSKYEAENVVCTLTVDGGTGRCEGGTIVGKTTTYTVNYSKK